MSFIDELNKQD